MSRPDPSRCLVLTGALALVVVASFACSGSGTQGPTPESRLESQRPEFERIARELSASDNEYLGHATLAEMRANVDSMGALSPPQRLNALINLCLAQLNAGKPDEALDTIERGFALVEQYGRPVPPSILRLRGLVNLRRAEAQNCVMRHNPESCIFPLRGEGLHVVKEPALAAKRDYLAALELEPDKHPLRILWLLNILSMALGEYPEGLPPSLRIPPSVFESSQQLERFADVAPRLGLDALSLCGGCIVEDFDNDGLLDVVTSTSDPWGPLTFFRNRGDGSFEDRSEASRLDEQLGGLNCIAADYDNDGRRDVLVLRGAWLKDHGQIRNSLLRNGEDGRFIDVTRASGLAEPARPTQAAVWGDFDNDGDLDLYVGNESRAAAGSGEGNYPSQLFRNDSNGTFTDIAASAGVTNDRYCKAVSAGDYDNDGDLDLYVSNAGPNRLFRNEGAMRFTDVAPELGVAAPEGRSFAVWFFDYDNDGWLDLFVAAFDAGVADIAADLMGRPSQGKKPRLYRNLGDGTFADVTTRVGLDHVWLPMGASFGDLDNDGWLDIYLGTGEPDYRALVPNVMLRNDGGKAFVDVTWSGGFGHLQKGHGIAFADIDNDGDQDIYHQLGGFYTGDAYRNALFLNPGNDNRFLTIELVGTTSNRDGLGARIRVVLETDSGDREIHRAAGSVSSFGGSPFRQEIGLGQARSIREVEIRWPASGSISRLEGLPLDSSIRVIEGQDGFETLDRRRVEM